MVEFCNQYFMKADISKCLISPCISDHLLLQSWKWVYSIEPRTCHDFINHFGDKKNKYGFLYIPEPALGFGPISPNIITSSPTHWHPLAPSTNRVKPLSHTLVPETRCAGNNPVIVDLEAMIDPAVGQLLDQAGYYREFTKNGIRTDGRGFSDHRHIAVGSDDSRTSSNYGSSSVNAGKTKVSCSITVLIGTPSQQHPESGDVGMNLSRYSLSLVAHTYDFRPSKSSCSTDHQLICDLDFDVSLWPHCNIRFDQRSKPDEAFLLEQLLSDLITKYVW